LWITYLEKEKINLLLDIYFAYFALKDIFYLNCHIIMDFII